ncbi:MAG: hypothetical protein QG668_578 [Patescibacteria group bacterium]|nr:hypothetical protein [Patescibacteria group bacterium]
MEGLWFVVNCRRVFAVYPASIAESLIYCAHEAIALFTVGAGAYYRSFG